MIGSGRYSWIDLDGDLQHGTHWDDMPEKMQEVISFIPDYPPEPHTEEQHEQIASFVDRLREMIRRCVH